jgi:hypothetical protein
VIDTQLASDAEFLPLLPSERGASHAAGIAVGEEVAAARLARAATDGSDAVWSGTIPVGPGFWLNGPPPPQPLSPRYDTPQTAQTPARVAIAQFWQ